MEVVADPGPGESQAEEVPMDLIVEDPDTGDIGIPNPMTNTGVPNLGLKKVPQHLKNKIEPKSTLDKNRHGLPTQKEKEREHHIEVLKEEIIASHVMKDLTNKYGTKGKFAKDIFLSAFEDELNGGGKTQFLKFCEEDPAYANGWGPTNKELTEKAKLMNRALGQMMERPAAMVTQSAFLHKLDEQVKHEIQRLNCGPPVYEMSWLFEGGQGQGGTDQEQAPNKAGSNLSVRDALREPEEKLFARHKVYQRAFSAVILHFEALRPILRDIKRIYDFVLSVKDAQLREAKIVTRNIHHAEKALDAQMQSIRFEGYARVAELEKQCMLLMTHVEKQDVAINTMTLILIRLENALTEEHDIRMEADDSRKLLIVEINELRRKMGMGPRQESGSGVAAEEEKEGDQGPPDAITTNDPLILRTALEICRKDLSDAQRRLTVLEADYADVIPRHEFLELKAAMEGVKESERKTNASYDALASQVQGFKDQIEKLISERDTLQEQVNSLGAKATPRPSWTKIAEHVEGGLPYWETIYKGRSSNEIVDKLVEELTGKKVNAPPEYVDGLGNTLAVPRHLRHSGKVRVRYLTRRDMCVIVNDIWQSRIQQLESYRKSHGGGKYDEEETPNYYGTSTSVKPSTSAALDTSEEVTIKKFQEYFADYFEQHYHIPSLRMEWTYNIVNGIKRLAIDEKLNQFIAILEGTCDEMVYHLFKTEAAKLQEALIIKSEALNPTGSLPQVPVTEFWRILKSIFPTKTEDQFQRLTRAAAKQSSAFAEWSPVRFSSFFTVTDEGFSGLFIEELCRQLDEDRLRYVYEILGEILSDIGVSMASAEREGDPARDTDVSMLQVFSALTSVDPTLPDDKLGSALAWLFMGESTLPGTTPKGLNLVDYIKAQVRRQAYDNDEHEDEHDDADFERAIADIIAGEEEDFTTPTKQKQAALKKLRFITLGLLVTRLKGGAFLRYGRRYPMAEYMGDDEDEEGEDEEGDGEGRINFSLGSGVSGGYTKGQVTSVLSPGAGPKSVPTSAATLTPESGTPKKGKGKGKSKSKGGKKSKSPGGKKGKKGKGKKKK